MASRTPRHRKIAPSGENMRVSPAGLPDTVASLPRGPRASREPIRRLQVADGGVVTWSGAMRHSIQIDAGRQRSRPVWQFLLVIAIAGPCAPGARGARREGVAGGAGGSGVRRGPGAAARGRKPLPRLAVFTLGSFTYE